jgi:Flp pilus assembly protein TadG
LAKNVIKTVLKKLRAYNFLADRSGNFGLTLALTFVPMAIGIGVSIDYVRAWNVKLKMQDDLDAALIASIKEVDALTEEKLQKKVSDWFVAQADLTDASYALAGSSITVNKTDRTIEATAAGTIETSFLKIAHIDTIAVAAKSAVSGPATSYMEVYIVIDKSASMLLASTSTLQATLRADKNISCEFACHDTSDPVYKKGTSTKLADSYYDYIKANYSASLRSDVAVDAVSEVLDLIEEANRSDERIKVGLYTMGEGLIEVLAPTTSTSKAESYLKDDSKKLTSMTSEGGTYFDKSLSALMDKVGTAGDGSSVSSPLKLVLLLTDGVQSERNWVFWWNKPNYDVLNWNSSQSDTAKKRSWNVVTPLNPDWCSGMKTSGATIGILYTEYLPVTADWGYKATVGATMASSRYKSTWGATMRSEVPTSTTRQAYIPYALKDCASSDEMFLMANDPVDIEAGLSSLFNQYVGQVRLTQ